MRKLVSIVAAAAFLASTTVAFADGAQVSSTSQAAPLAPGSAAGVHNAQLFGLSGLGLVGLAGGVVILTTTVIVLTKTSQTSGTTH
ncbi:MAG: hypothetical protein ABSC92_01365 [Rhizomicrobium sp.]|jgi:hypothetical protein